MVRRRSPRFQLTQPQSSVFHGIPAFQRVAGSLTELKEVAGITNSHRRKRFPYHKKLEIVQLRSEALERYRAMSTTETIPMFFCSRCVFSFLICLHNDR